MFQSSTTSSYPVKACKRACLWWLLLRPSGNRSGTESKEADEQSCTKALGQKHKQSRT